MTEAGNKWIRAQARFNGIFDGEDGRFGHRVPLSSAAVYGECREYIGQALEAGLDGSQVRLFEEELAGYVGVRHAVALSSGQAAFRLALRLAAGRLYGGSTGNGGSLSGRRVFCPDLTAAGMADPIVSEGGEPVFIDSSDQDWSMDPEVLELAFGKYPDTRIVAMSHAYGFPGQAVRVRQVCFEHGALLIECAGEALGASCPVQGTGVWGKAGAFGDYAVLDFGKGKIIGANGGALLMRDSCEAERARHWASGACGHAPWRQHEEPGCRCTMGELDAALLRGQLLHIEEAIGKKKAVYERYLERLDGELAYVIRAAEGARPNYWLTAMTCESSIQFMETRDDRGYTYRDIHGTAAPMEIFDALRAFGAECRPVYKPMSMQPAYRNCEHFTLDGAWRRHEDFRDDTFWLRCDMAGRYYECGIVLPSDAGMTAEEQDKVIEIVLACYNMEKMDRMGWA